MKRARIGIVLLVCLALVACVGLQAQWEALTPDAKARVVLNDLQDQLTSKFTEAKAFVVLNPKYQDTWKTKINPAFDVANKGIKAALDTAKAGKMTPEIAYQQVQPLVAQAIILAIQAGLIK